MCCKRNRSIRQSYNQWIESKQIHPIWLYIVANKEAQSRFDFWIKSKFAVALNYFCIIGFIAALVSIIHTFERPFNEKSLGYVLYGSLLASILILCIAIKINLAAINYGFISIVGVRVVVTFVLFHLLEIEASGFESIDPKQLSDSIPIISILALLLTICNWSAGLLIYIPLITITTYLAVNRSYSMDSENMEFCSSGLNEKDRISQRWILTFIFLLACIYSIRKITLQRFLDQELTKK